MNRRTPCRRPSDISERNLDYGRPTKISGSPRDFLRSVVLQGEMRTHYFMKSILSRALLCVFLSGAVMAQPQTAPTNGSAPTPVSPTAEKETSPAPIRFDLDFKGGSVRALFDALSSARGKPVNVYLPRETETIVIAPFRVSGVTVKDILGAISSSSEAKLFGEMRERLFRYSFFCVPDGSDSGVWSVKVSDLYTPESPVCRVYSLSPYLEAGLSVDDITTAIRTAWKMSNYTPSTVNLSYHRETKLLIAVAPEDELKAIDQVLAALPKGSAGKKSTVAAPTEPPKVPAAKL